MSDKDKAPGKRRRADRAPIRQGLHHEARRGRCGHCRSRPSPPAASRSDIALGVGGLPRGRVVEIYGPESSGKTTLRCTVIAEAQTGRRRRRVHRRRARARPALRAQSGRRSRQSARLAARHRRAGARDRRDARALQRGRHRRRSTRSPRSCRRRRSKATWATRTSGCRRASCRRRCASSPRPSASRAPP